MDFETAKDDCKLKNANCKLWAKAYEFRRVVVTSAKTLVGISATQADRARFEAPGAGRVFT
jgi:hypothetical protein